MKNLLMKMFSHFLSRKNKIGEDLRKIGSVLIYSPLLIIILQKGEDRILAGLFVSFLGVIITLFGIYISKQDD